MYHTDNLKDKLNFSILRKEIIQASLEVANKRIAALKSRVDIILKAKLKSKSNNNNNNNNNKSYSEKAPLAMIEIDTSNIEPKNLNPGYFLSAHPEFPAAASAQPQQPNSFPVPESRPAFCSTSELNDLDPG